MSTCTKVTVNDIEWLEVAIDEASIQRGALMPEDWPEFDERIQTMRAALKRCDDQRKLINLLRKQGRLAGFE